ncbi:MAG: PepSY domain-containing protein [Pseudohongiellaceae bacterium]
MNLNFRSWHRMAGWVLLLPFFAWAVTGIFFLVRPAYEDAYQPLKVQTYPRLSSLELPVSPQWQEYRFLESVLGAHLLVLTQTGWMHLDAETGEPWPQPDRGQLTLLVNDAIKSDLTRYGRLVGGEGQVFLTDTGVKITLDWASFSLTQSGRDTYWINQVYDIHYLRWTGIDWLDSVLGVSGLLLLLLTTFTGMSLLLRKPLYKV